MRVMWRVLAGAVCFAAISQVSGATNLQLTGTGGTAVNIGSESVYVYPYDFGVDGSSATTQLMCLNFNNDITMGESWSVNVDTVAQAANGNSTLLTDYEEQAWLYSQITPSTSQSQQTLIQFAVWDILDPSGVGTSSDPYWNANSTDILNLINQASTAVGGESPDFFNQFAIYGEWIPGRRSADLYRRIAHAGARKSGAAGDRTAGPGGSRPPQNAQGLGFRQC
jgi:hypothetical protein